MESDETASIIYICRLCLSYREDCIEIDSVDSVFGYQIKNFFQIEMNLTDLLPRTVCQSCIERIQTFDRFCDEVKQNQDLLRVSLSKEVNSGIDALDTSSNLIQVSPVIIPKSNQTLIITLQTDSTLSYESNEASKCIQIDDKTINQPIQNAIVSVIEKFDENAINVSCIERELDELATDDITSDEHIESDIEDDGLAKTVNLNVNNINNVNEERFKDFPAQIIDGCRLLFRGHDLLKMISKFYRLQCDQCHENTDPPVFTNLSDLCQHYAEHHKIKGYVTCCNIKLIKPRAMALHMARHLQPSAFTCTECNKVLTCPKILRYHIQNHRPESERPLACSQCPRRFSYSSALVAHIISHQPEDQRAAHVCNECGKVFVSAGRLTTHINVSHIQHGKNFTCHICNKKFACRTNLTYHLTTHQPKVRQVQCEICGKWLKNKLCLSKHMVQHSSIRYSCTMCNYSALNRQCLRNHIRVQHTNEKPFRCDVCDKTFKLKNTLISHSVQHTGVRKFVCPFCNRTFASSGNFYSHRKRMHPQQLAAMKLKQEDDERRLREQTQKPTETNS